MNIPAFKNGYKWERLTSDLSTAMQLRGINVKILYEDEMMAVLPPHHPLSASKIISLARLAREPFIFAR